MSFLNTCIIRSTRFNLYNTNLQFMGKVKYAKYLGKQNFHGNAANRIEDKSDLRSITVPSISPSDFQKRILLWVGTYKSKEEIPNKVPFSTIDKATNRARIKVCNYMIVVTIIGFVYTAISGRRAQQAGQTVAKMNEDWHREMNKQYEEEQKALHGIK